LATSAEQVHKHERVNRLLFFPGGIPAIVVRDSTPPTPWRCRIFGHLVARDCECCHGATPFGECYRCGAMVVPEHA
jgi:hypothetical protein